MAIRQTSTELGLKEYQVKNVVDLLIHEECSVPFVARYRKEKTGSLDEEVIRQIRDRYIYISELEKQKRKYLKVVAEHCQKRDDLDYATLEKAFLACNTKSDLEDLYLPFKPKRRSRAETARSQGLAPLCAEIVNYRNEIKDLGTYAKDFANRRNLKDVENPLQGASDIFAEQISENIELRKMIRELSFKTAQIVSKKIMAENANEKLKEKAKKYESYFEYKEHIDSAPSHRVMAVRRGEAEKILSFQIEVYKEKILENIKNSLKEDEDTKAFLTWMDQCIEDAYKRLIAPSIETEIRVHLKNRAEVEAIRVFATNLKSLLMSPPVGQQIIMGIDPGYRTGSKIAIVSNVGGLLEHRIIHPKFDKEDDEKTAAAEKDIVELIHNHHVNYVAIGNGTGGREISRLVSKVFKKFEIKDVKRVFVNEAGASVYSTDAIAREEFPDLDPTIRSAISIARRMQDPLAELVKIDPRSIGVGQYQHDVSVNRLKSELEEVVESCVNKVGVDLNSASAKLLSYVSGIGPALAKNIIEFRQKTGKFERREQLLTISGFGPKAFVQAAGFLRIPSSSFPLDNSSVHPESYDVVEKMAKDLGVSLEQLVGNPEVITSIPVENYVTAQIGLPTLMDIIEELKKPGRDPRDSGEIFEYRDDVCDIDDLKVDMELKGTITNVTDFGAFVDVGVHQDGLVHKSELSTTFIKDPNSFVSVGDILNVRVIEVDVERKRISFSCKPKDFVPKQRTQKSQDKTTARPPNKNFKQKARQNKKSGKPFKKRQPKDNKTYTMDDLLSKFSQNS